MEKLWKNIKTPEELQMFMDKYVHYGFIGTSGKKYLDSSTMEFQLGCVHDWLTKSGEEIIEDGYGHCFDQVEVERLWFENHHYEYKTIFISFDDYGARLPCHTTLLYKQHNHWFWFEHASGLSRGIHEYSSLEEALYAIKQQHLDYTNQMTDVLDKKIYVTEYSKPQTGLTDREFKKILKKEKNVL